MPDAPFDVLVVGGGPAGMAAAVRAAESKGQVAVVDDNATLGGQIWRGASGSPLKAVQWQDRLRQLDVAIFSGARVFHQPAPGVLLAECFEGVIELQHKNLILATGARERFLPFPGWTLPHVMGAGGLQALVKSGLPIEGKRIVIAGTGPLLLAVASYLRGHRAEIPVICEQAPWRRLVVFGLNLLGSPTKLSQAWQLKSELPGIPFAPNSWPVSVQGTNQLQSVTILRDGRSETIPCDYLACGFHLVPNIELAQLLGCSIKDGVVQVDDFQRTTQNNIFCAGEPTGIGGVELSLLEGQIAGLAASGAEDEARQLFAARAKARRFALALDRTFRLRPELKNLAAPETMVCRCEDVRFSQLKMHSSWRTAKLHTRCGMGPCQGRICGPAAEFLFDWTLDSVRPPVFPAQVASLASPAKSEQTTTGVSQ